MRIHPGLVRDLNDFFYPLEIDWTKYILYRAVRVFFLRDSTNNFDICSSAFTIFSIQERVVNRTLYKENELYTLAQIYFFTPTNRQIKSIRSIYNMYLLLLIRSFYFISKSVKCHSKLYTILHLSQNNYYIFNSQRIVLYFCQVLFFFFCFLINYYTFLI